MYREAAPGPPRSTLPALVAVDWAKLGDAGRARVEARRTEGALASWEPPSPVALTGAALMVGVPFAMLLILAPVGFGLVPHVGRPMVSALAASLAHGVLAIFGARLALAAIDRRRRLPVAAGRSLLRAGLLVSTRDGLLLAPADRIADVVIDPRRHLDVVVVLDDGSEVALQSLGLRPEAAERAREQVLERKAAIDRARASADLAALARLELASREELEAARTTLRTAARWRVSLLAGALVAALAYLVVMPELSIRLVGDGTTYRWRSIAENHPLPWIEARAAEEIARRRESIVEPFLARVAPVHREPLSRLLRAAPRDGLVTVLHVDVPIAGDAPEAQTAALRAMLPEGTSIEPVTLVLPRRATYGERPGSDRFAYRLQEALELPQDVLRVGSRDLGGDWLEDAHPRLDLTLSARPVGAIELRELTLAALEITVEPRLWLDEDESYALGAPIVVPAPDALALEAEAHPTGDVGLRTWPRESTPTQRAYWLTIERAVRHATDVIVERIFARGSE